MGNVAWEQGFDLQQLFLYKYSSFFKKFRACIKSRFLLTMAANLANAFSISGIRQVIAHNFMKRSSRDGLAAKDLLAFTRQSF